MRKLIINAVGVGLMLGWSHSNAQVQVNVEKGKEDLSASLQVGYRGVKKGVSIPQVALTSKTNYAPIRTEPKEGLMVYNTIIGEELGKGYYFWSKVNGGHWESLGGVVNKSTIIQNISPSVLGYDPKTPGASAPENFKIGSINATKIKCVTWELNVGGNGHTYCGYELSGSVDFGQLFGAAKSLDAYILTVTSSNEWNFVKENLVKNVTSPIWLGYATVRTPGNPYKYRWITGETWNNSWGNSASVQAVFAPGNPKSTVDYYGANPYVGDYESKNAAGLCALISGSAYNQNRLWYSAGCDSKNFESAEIKQIIVEFNQ